MWLLDRGADLNTRCYLDLTPLSFAVRYAHPSTINTLLNMGDILMKGGDANMMLLYYGSYERGR
jgi:ankyrin repeat protein